MAKLKTKWVEDNAINQDKFRSDNDAFIKGRNAADSADENIIKVNASDELELGKKLNDPDSSAPTTDTQLANKKYVDDTVAGITIPSAWELQGNWSAATNTPTLDNTDTGVDSYLYYVNAAGSVDFGAGSTTFSVGDWVYNVSGAWEKADNNDDVVSVNGATGAVVLDADDISDAATTNKFTTAADISKLAGIESGATADQTGAEIKAAYEGEADTNAFTDAEQTKLAGVEAGAEVNKTMGREVITITAQNITDGWFEISQPASANSLRVTPVGAVEQTPGTDYTESVVVTNTRVTFAGDLLSEVAANDEIIVHYEY